MSTTDRAAGAAHRTTIGDDIRARVRSIDPRCATVLHMLGGLQEERASTLEKLRVAVRLMVDELDPRGERDHTAHWMVDRPVPRDAFDRVRWSADELVVLSAQMLECQPWTSPAGRVGLEAATASEQAAEAGRVVRIFGDLVAAEEVPLHRLEGDVKGLQLRRRWYGNPDAALLPQSIRAMREQHTAAVHVVRLLERVAG